MVGENRTIPVRKGAFSDRFADGNAIHIYRINGGSRCEPRNGTGNGKGKGKGKVSNVGLPGGGDPPTSSSPDFKVILAAVVLALAGMLAFFRALASSDAGVAAVREADEANPPSHESGDERPAVAGFRSVCA